MPDDSRFCGECGNAITAPIAPEPPEVESVAHVVDLESKAGAVPDGLKYGIVAGSFLIPLIGIIMGLIYIVNGENDEKKSAGRLWLVSGIVLGVIWIAVGGGGY